MKNIATNSLCSELMLTVNTFHQKKKNITHFNLVLQMKLELHSEFLNRVLLSMPTTCSVCLYNFENFFSHLVTYKYH